MESLIIYHSNWAKHVTKTQQKQTYSNIKYRLPNRIIKIQFLGGLPTDYQ